MVDEAEPAPLSPIVVRYLAIAFYLLLAAGGLLWVRVRTGAWWPESMGGGDVGSSLLFGVGFAVVVVAATGPLMKLVPWMRWLALEMRRLLGRLDLITLLAVALASGVGEEIFFRGAMQPVFGLVPTAVLFGLVHTGPNRRYLSWTAFAMIVGLALGAIVATTGNLLGAIAAHVLINLLNLGRISRMAASEPAGD